MEFPPLHKLPHDTTIQSQLEALAKAQPDKPAFVFIDAKWNRTVLTRREVWDFSRNFSAVLNRMGIKKGDVVCNCLVNSPQRVLTTFGAVLTGAIPLHGQILLADGQDFFHNLKMSRCTTVVVDPNEMKGAVKVLKSIEYTDERTGEARYKGLPYLVNVVPVDVCCSSNSSNDQYETWIHSLSQEPLYEDKNFEAEEIAWLFVTSGSTGFSKIVPQTHDSLLEFGVLFSNMCGAFDENAMYFSDRPLGWVGGHPSAYTCLGSTRVLTNQRYGQPSDYKGFICKLIAQEKCDCAFIVPFHLQQILEAMEEEIGRGRDLNFFKFRRIGCGGGPVSNQLVRCIGFLTDSLTVVYGLTECGAVASLTMEDTKDYIPLCVGKISIGVEARIVDTDMQDLPTGRTGEILLRSSMNTKGYLNEPEKSNLSCLPNNWFRTGDVGHRDEQGRLYVHNRTNDAIMRGAYILYPAWMEAKLAECPGVLQVVLIGVPDEVNYEEICAFVIPTTENPATEESLKQYSQDLFADAGKEEMVPVPKYFLFTDQFPVNDNGKVRRPLLKEEARHLLML